jgi:hypothetical protein
MDAFCFPSLMSSSCKQRKLNMVSGFLSEPCSFARRRTTASSSVPGNFTCASREQISSSGPRHHTSASALATVPFCSQADEFIYLDVLAEIFKTSE